MNLKTSYPGVFRIGLVVCLFLMFLLARPTGAGQALSGSQGPVLLAHGDYKAAIAAFQSALAKDAGDKVARDGLLTAQIEIGQYKEAEARILEYAKAGADPSLLDIQGSLFLEVGRYQEAATAFQRASQGSGGKELWRALLGSSQALLAMGKDDEARAQLNKLIEQATETAPKSAEEMTLLADALVSLEKFQESNDFYID